MQIHVDLRSFLAFSRINSFSLYFRSLTTTVLGLPISPELFHSVSPFNLNCGVIQFQLSSELLNISCTLFNLSPWFLCIVSSYYINKKIIPQTDCPNSPSVQGWQLSDQVHLFAGTFYYPNPLSRTCVDLMSSISCWEYLRLLLRSWTSLTRSINSFIYWIQHHLNKALEWCFLTIHHHQALLLLEHVFQSVHGQHFWLTCLIFDCRQILLPFSLMEFPRCPNQTARETRPQHSQSSKYQGFAKQSTSFNIQSSSDLIQAAYILLDLRYFSMPNHEF